MKCFLSFAIICCLVSNTWTAPTNSPPHAEDPLNPTLVTGAALIAQRTCGPVNALISLGVGKATAEGIKKYQETNDAIQATRVAAENGISTAAEFIRVCASAAITGTSIANDIRSGKDPKEAIADRTKSTIDYYKEEILKRPKGPVTNSMIAIGNCGLTWTMGPMAGWIAATVAKAAAEGYQKYLETKNIEIALKLAAETGYNSASQIFQCVCDAVSGTVAFADDVSSRRKDVKTAVLDRCGSVLKYMISPNSANSGTSSGTNETNETNDTNKTDVPNSSAGTTKSLKRNLSEKSEPSSTRQRRK